MMKHKNCGGEIKSDPRKAYSYDNDGKQESHPALRCTKCGREILGDPDIEEEDNAESSKQS